MVEKLQLLRRGKDSWWVHSAMPSAINGSTTLHGLYLMTCLSSKN
jgi:hypothetical protein